MFLILKRNSCSFELIDMVALSGTQGWGLFHSDDIKINYCYDNLIKVMLIFSYMNLEYMSYFNGSHKYYDSHIEIQKSESIKSANEKYLENSIFSKVDKNKSEIYQRLKNLDNIETNVLKSFQSNFLIHRF